MISLSTAGREHTVMPVQRKGNSDNHSVLLNYLVLRMVNLFKVRAIQILWEGQRAKSIMYIYPTMLQGSVSSRDLIYTENEQGNKIFLKGF